MHAAVVFALDPGDGGVVELLQGERLDALQHGHEAALDGSPPDLALTVLIGGHDERRRMNNAKPVQSLLDFAGHHGRAVVGHQGPGQTPLHERLAEPVNEDLGGLRQVPLQMAAEPRMIVEEAQQDRRLPFAGRRQHPAPAMVEVRMPERVAALDLVAQHLAGLDPRRGLGFVEAPPAPLAHQPQRLHDPGHGGVGGQPAESRIRVDERPQIVVVQPHRPRRMSQVLIAQRRDQ